MRWKRYLWWLLVDAATAAALVVAWIQVSLVGAWVDAAWWPRTIAAVRGTR